MSIKRIGRKKKEKITAAIQASLSGAAGVAAVTADGYQPKAEDFVLVPPAETGSVDSEAVGGVRHENLKRFFARKSAVAGVIILGFLILMSIIGPHISGHSYDEQDLTRADMAPRVPGLASMGILDGTESVPKIDGTISQNKYEENGITDTYYVFGTDSLGRDLFARCFMGLRISLIIALLATAINLIIGMNYGIISGYFGGMTDIFMQRTVDVIGSIPTLVVVTLLMLVLKPGMGSIVLALMLSGWIQMSLIARAEVLKVKELEYVQAARTMGAGHAHIIFRDIQHLGHKPACIESDSFTGFEKDLKPVLLLHTAYAALQPRYVVVLTGDVVTAAEVYPLHFRQYISEFILNCVQSSL